MPQILHSTLTPSTALVAAASAPSFDLPVNPLSVILITLTALNNIATIGANFLAGAANLMSKLSNVRIRYRGASVIDGDPLDLAQIFGGYSRWWPIQGQINQINNDVRSVTFPLLLGRKPYDVLECFPATRRGDLILDIDAAADPTGLDGFAIEIETIELLDAAPERFIKVSTTQRTLASGPVNSIDLPIGNKLLGVLLRGVTFPTGASNNASFGTVNLEVDNVEVVLSAAQWRGLHATWARRARIDWLEHGHRHLLDLAVNATDPILTSTALGLIDASSNDSAVFSGTGTATTGHTGIAPAPEIPALQRYGLIDLDPMNDSQMAIDTRSVADISIEIDSDVTDGSASRALPIEEVEVTSIGIAA